MEDNKKTAFDKLVAGLSASDRAAMLENINRTSARSTQFSGNKEKNDVVEALDLRFKSESALYKLILMIRSLFTKKTAITLYNDDIIAAIARKVNRDYPSLINHKAKVLDSIFYERLKSLRDAADFFKPYFALVNEDPGDFYVFLSSFVAPELSEKINKEADPFILPFTREGKNEVRNELLKKLDEILSEMPHETKSKIYSAVTAASWLEQFAALPFIHFLSQFTAITDTFYTCPYKNAINDYDRFAAVFTNIISVPNEVTEALFLFSQRKDFTKNTQEKDIENALCDFMGKANTHFGTIQMFIAGIPFMKLGRIVNNNSDWQAGNIEGAEAWFPAFRSQWRKIFEIRWNDWLREQKKERLSSSLKSDFDLDTFPVMAYRPWKKLWTRVPFSCELTGGFISWFSSEKYDEIYPTLSAVLMDGIFLRSDNRTEYSDALNLFITSNNQMKELMNRLSPVGDYGTMFNEMAQTKVRSFQSQKQIDSIMSTVVNEVREITMNFCNSSRIMEGVFHGFFDDVKDGIHETLSNLNTIKGHHNREFREELVNARSLIKKAVYYISELEPIDAISQG